LFQTSKSIKIPKGETFIRNLYSEQILKADTSAFFTVDTIISLPEEKCNSFDKIATRGNNTS
jgi:hypothetical protein